MLLPHLTEALRSARQAAGVSQRDIADLYGGAQRGTKAGRTSVSINRFEKGYFEGWPRDPDALVAAYADATEKESYELWLAALTAWMDDLRSDDEQARQLWEPLRQALEQQAGEAVPLERVGQSRPKKLPRGVH